MIGNDYNLFDVLRQAADARRRGAGPSGLPPVREVWATPARRTDSADLKRAEVLAIDGKPVRR